MATYVIVLFFSIIYFRIMIKTNWLSDLDFNDLLTGLYSILFGQILSVILVVYLIGSPILLLFPNLEEQPGTLMLIIFIILMLLSYFIKFIKKRIITK